MKNTLCLWILVWGIMAMGLQAQPEFTDNMDSYNTGLWIKAEGWTNGVPFNCTWRADCITFQNGQARLAIDYDSGGTVPYKGAEYRSNVNYHYGFYECRMRASNKSGTVCSLVLYTGPAHGTIWDEIDIEILGNNPTRMQCNYFADSQGGHEYMVNLGFDASQGFHNYAFEWQPGHIKWFVDGKLVHTVNNTGQKFPVTPSMYIITFWNGTVPEWMGPFDGQGLPVYVYYDWVRFLNQNPYTTAVTPTPTATPTPTPTATVTRGDVNSDQAVNINDALLVAQYSAGFRPSDFNTSAADTDCNNTISVLDALLIARYSAGLLTGFCR